MTTLVFEDLDTLRAALDAGVVPAEVQASAVMVEIDDDGSVRVETEVQISRADQKHLRDAGVAFRRTSLQAPQSLSCWAEILPTQVAPEPEPPLGEVLFMSEGDEGFLRISGELLRLGSEDQRLTFFTDEQGVRRNLCRVPDPPYYAILRAFDRDDPLRAFVPVRPGSRVWIELGASHPMAGRLDGQPGQLILIPRSPGRGAQAAPWLRVPDGPWVDLHAVSNIALPVATEWTPSKPSARLQVALRLVRAPSKRPADLWVVRERAIEQVEDLVRTLPEEVTLRLRFAIVEHEDPVSGGTKTQVVLRARRSAAAPPALQLDAEAYVPAPQIPDLYLPVGMMLDPPLRPNRLRELFGNDSSRIMWLAPAEDAGRGRAFRRESLPESGFAPLSDWVEYLVGAHEARLEPWVRSTIFDFDKHVSIGVEWAEGAAPPAKDKQRPDKAVGRRREPLPTAEPTPDFPAIDFGGAEILPDAVVPVIDFPAIELPRSAIEEQLAALEQRFCELETPLDDPARVGLWAELGNLQAALHRSREAALCWSRALWEPSVEGGTSSLSLGRRWVESECGMLGFASAAQLLGIVDVVESDLDEQMVRALAAEVVYIDLHARASELERTRSGAAAPPPLGGEMLARLQRFFTTHGALLDLRTLWLARSALARLAGDDRLALFQTRDAIMASLREGIGLSRNIPTFVRTHGSDGETGDLDRIGNELLRVRDEYLATKRTRSTIESSYPNARTDAYVRLVFAWGFARIGRPQVASEELAAAQQLFGTSIQPGGDAIHIAAHAAYRARVEQALEGIPPGAPFSAAPNGPIAARERLSGLDRFKYDRLVQLSRVLDPRQDVDAFYKWNHREDEPFAGIALLTRPEALADLFDRMLTNMASLGPEPRARELGVLLEYLEALPEPLAVARLRAALPHINSTPIDARPRLLRNALLIAGYHDRTDLIGEVLATLARSDAELTSAHPVDYAELLARGAPVLRRSNHESQLGALLTKLEERLAGDTQLAGVIARLHIAAAFASLGQPGRVGPAFAAAHALLGEPAMPTEYQALLRELSVALSRSNPGQAIAGAGALMKRLANTTDLMSTNSHYCLAVIQLMEAVITALASEDLVLSQWARAWVEEDEHLLHRRIHRDLAMAR